MRVGDVDAFWIRCFVLAAAVTVAGIQPAVADQLLSGRKLLVKNPPSGPAANKVVHVAKDAAITIGAAGSAGDPQCSGAGGGGASSLRVQGSGAAGDVTIPLPCAGWSTNRANSVYRYKDPTGASCAVVLVKNGVLTKAVCRGTHVAMDVGAPMAPVALVTTLNAERYCTAFGGAVVRDGADDKTFLAKDAPAPAACPADCASAPDQVPDVDGDGWNVCDGDCCESLADCPAPELVNPGAFEVAGNLVDDDCDGTADNALAACDGGLVSNSPTPLDYALAIDLCQATVESPPTLAEKRWGVISAELLLADGTGTPAANSRSIRPDFGTGVVPQGGNRLAILSTGRAADLSDVNPGFAAYQPGENMGTSSGFPADWLAANGGMLPNAPSCPAPLGTSAVDPVMLKVRVRVPTNARSFSVGTFFYTAEYAEYVCSPYNDTFLTLLDSTFVPMVGEAANPTDKNIAVVDPAPAGGDLYPVNVNLAIADAGLFRECVNGPYGCASGPAAGTINTCTSTAQLVGTGFDLPDSGAGCSASAVVGGGTGWLVTAGNVAPGETIEVRFVIWDTSDSGWDASVLLDNWVWSSSTVVPGTQ